MKIEIKHCLTGSVLFVGDFSCLADAVKSALSKGANLRSADLSSADLSSANLSYANLSYANLRSANLRSADLSSAKNISKQSAAELLMCPEEGDFIGWKKCSNGVVAKLLIPAKAARSSATSRKCRAEFVKVLALFKDGKPVAGPVETNTQDIKTVYAIGKTVKPDKWDADRWNECSNGIHFFITRTEAENY